MQRKCVFFISFVLGAFVSGIRTARSNNDSCSKFDITHALNGSIVNIFNTEYFDPDRITGGLLYSIQNRVMTYYVTENSRKRKPFADLIVFSDLYFSITAYSAVHLLSWDRSENKTYIKIERIEMIILGYVDVPQNVSNRSSRFSTSPEIRDLSICVTQLPANEGNRKINVSASFGFFDIRGDTIIHDYERIKYKVRHRMAYTMNNIFPSMIIDRITGNKVLSQYLENAFFTQPDREIMSKYPDFRANKEKYYYKIPQIALEHMSFNDIQIVGLLNFESVEVGGSKPDYIYTLRVNNVSGNMDLNFKNNEKKLDNQIAAVNFTINCLSILIDCPSKRINVEAKDYSIIEIPLNLSIPISKWLSKYTSTIMEHIELAIARSIMPYMNVQMKNESSFELSTRQMQSSFIQEHDEDITM